MPSKSPAQARMMQAVAHSPEFARKVGIPQSVGRKFSEADKHKQVAVAHALRRKSASGSISTPGSAAGG